MEAPPSSSAKAETEIESEESVMPGIEIQEDQVPVAADAANDSCANGATVNDDNNNHHPNFGDNDCDVHTQSHTVRWIPTLMALLRKNLLLVWRSPIQLAIILCLPAIAVALTKGCQALASSGSNGYNEESSSSNSAMTHTRQLLHQRPIEACEWYDVYRTKQPHSCVTVLFAPFEGASQQDVEDMQAVMERVATEAGLSYGTSLEAPELLASTKDVHGLPSAKEMGDFLVAHPGRASTIVYFRSPLRADTDILAPTLSSSPMVDIRFNRSSTSSSYYDDYYGYYAADGDFRAVTNQVLVPQAIRRATEESSSLSFQQSGQSGQSGSVRLKISVSAFGDTSGDGFDVSNNTSNSNANTTSSNIGSELDDESDTSIDDAYDEYQDDQEAQIVAIFFPILMSFAFVTSGALLGNHAANEKQLFLVGSLRVVGMADSAYWSSWMLVHLFLQLPSSLLAIVLAYIVDLPVVTEGAFLAPFLALFTTGVLMFAVIMTIVAMARSRPLLYGLQFVILLAGIIGPSLSTGFTAASKDLGGRICQAVLPGYNLGKIIISIFEYNRRARGTGVTLTSYQASTMFERIGNCNYAALSESGICIMEPKFDEWSSACWDYSGCGAVTDNCAPDYCYYYPISDFSSIVIIVAQVVVFMLLAWYLFQIIPSGNGLVYKPWFIFDCKYWRKSSPQSAEGEQLKSREEESILIRSITKTFNKSSVVAVNSVDLDISKGQVFVMLGHNGAGKTTLINMMTGKLAPTSGDAFVMGKSVKRDLHSIQKLVGSVPQHDLLWNELSAYEHIRMFAKIKGISSSHEELRDQVHSILKKVHLDASSLQAAGAYSGGMKRRLSIALAGIGDPKVLFMDEPTTGIDPLNRRRIWNLVRELKKDRIIVLTTHLMQEADTLGDNIAILDNGTVQAQGTPLNLKTEHGTGYTLNIVSDMENVERVTAMVQSKIPSAQIVSSAAGSLAIGIPRDGIGGVPDLTRQLQEQELIREWSVSQSTLEEVFLRLAQSSTSLQNRHEEVSSTTVNTSHRQTPTDVIEEDGGVGAREVPGEREQAADIENNTPTVFAIGRVLWGLQVSALVRKAFILKRRAWIASTVQFAVPIILMSVLYATIFKPLSFNPQYEVLVWPQATTYRWSQQSYDECSFEWLISSVFDSDRDPLKTLTTTKGAVNSILYPASGSSSTANLHFDVATTGTNVTVPALRDALVAGMEFLLSRSSTPDAQGLADAECTDMLTCGPCSVTFLDWNSTELEGGVVRFLLAGVTGSGDFSQCSSYGDVCPASTIEYLLGNEQVLSYAGDYLGSSISLVGSFRYSQGASKTSSMIPRTSVDEEGAYCFTCGDIDAHLWVSGSGADSFAGAVSRSAEDIVATVASEDVTTAVRKSRRSLEVMSTTFTEQELFDYSDCASIGRSVWEWNDTHQESGYIVNALNPTADEGLFDQAQDNFNRSTCEAPLGSVEGYHDLFPDAGVSISLSKIDDLSEINVHWVFYQNDQQASYPLYYQSVYSVHCASQDANLTTGECLPGAELRCSRVMPERACDKYASNVDGAIIKSTYAILAEAGEIGSSPIFRDFQSPESVYYHANVSLIDISLLCLVIGLSLAIVVPSTASTLVMEKHQRYVFTLLLNGLELRNYWLAHYLFHAVSTLLLSLILVVLGVAFQLGAYVSQDVNFGLLTLMLITYGHAQFCFLALTSNIFRRERFAAVMLGFVVFAAFGAALIVHEVANDWPAALNLIPMFGCFRGLVLVFWAYQGYSEEYWKLWGIMLSSSLLYLCLGIYWHGATGVGAILNFGCKASAESAVGVEEDDEEVVDGAEADVASEQKRALAIAPYDTAVKIVHLGKTFPARPSPKHAVVDLSMAMDYGEIFGLLGPNGSGKTTTISMLVGQITPSRGSAHVAGFDSVAHRKEAIQKLGIVPQFDVVYPDLTVQEHLEMFAATKGCARKNQTSWAKRNAQTVGLGGTLFERKANALSGGMRRRLSIAIALLSDPSVVFLDEPTTGLDPDMKRAVWNIIESMRNDRCIILTTHAMDEAEALCSRIGIMAQGSLRCVGTQTELRERYGSTFEITFTIPSTPESNDEELTNFLLKHSKSAKVVSSQSHTRVYTMDKADLELAALFEMVIQGQNDGLYTEWNINNTSLDEIFVTITAESEGVDASELL